MRNAVLDLKAHNTKLADKVKHDQAKVSALESEKKALKQELGDTRAKYDSQVC